ncbi:helix-turn-helix domain-containing protein [Paraburkholderia sp. MMS20-SJTN17]|uniref:Helix-turn-helix domain-containing protein n=2 Tax=Paraburkholderia translucens TaxID=2886945 RepID=A0ABS8KHK8_9BURK|nr:helix-turn-helix domain-containing protein [Paraburkholderia sp. MMS20-SJTN17]
MKKDYKHLSAEERAATIIERRKGASIRAMALLLRLSASTVSRELTRNRCAVAPCYDATGAASPHRLRHTCCAREAQVRRWQCPVSECARHLIYWRWSCTCRSSGGAAPNVLQSGASQKVRHVHRDRSTEVADRDVGHLVGQKKKAP